MLVFCIYHWFNTCLSREQTLIAGAVYGLTMGRVAAGITVVLVIIQSSIIVNDFGTRELWRLQDA